MKKVLYVTTINLTSNTFLVPHINHLLELGYEIEIANSLDVPLSENLDNRVVHNQIDFSRNPLHFLNIRAYYQIKELLKLKNYDIVHVHTPVAAFITRMALRKQKVKVVYTAHGFHFYKGAPLINWLVYYPLESIAARWTDTFVTINNEDYLRAKKFKMREGGKVKLIHGVGIDPRRYELKGFNRDGYREMLGLSNEDFVILILAELNKNKNHIQIIKAMELLKDKYPNIKVLCGGKGPLEGFLKEKVQQMELTHHVHFIGFREDVRELISSCDCVGLFSKREGLGKCLLEGMLFNKLLLATNTRGPRQIIKNNENGFLVEVNDYHSTANLIERMYLNYTNKVNLNPVSHLVDSYKIDNVLKEVRSLYE